MEQIDQLVHKKNKRTLVAILIVAILPVALAYLAFFTGIGVPDNTVNAGVLLKSPIKVKDLFGRQQSELVNDIETEKKWRILVPVFEHCNESCMKNLYTTRQVHVRLSEKGARLERYAINLGGDKGAEFLDSIQKEYPYLKRENANHLRWYQWLDSSRSGLSNMNEHFYLLVDQEGFAMMVYTNKQHGNELLKDIKRALKFSIDYQ